MDNVYIYLLTVVLGAVVSDAAPGHVRRQLECNDEDFSACNAILKRVDVEAEYCRVKEQYELCTEQMIDEIQCTINKDSQVATTLQKLIDLDCKTVAECFQRLENVSKLITDKFFTDDETFCSEIDSVTSHGYYILNNCNNSLPEYALQVADELILKNYQSLKEIRCSQTEPPKITVSTATAAPVVTTRYVTLPSSSTTRSTTVTQTTPVTYNPTTKIPETTTETPVLPTTTTELSSVPTVSALTTTITEISSMPTTSSLTTSTDVSSAATTADAVSTSTESEYYRCFEMQFFSALEKRMSKIVYNNQPEKAIQFYCSDWWNQDDPSSLWLLLFLGDDDDDLFDDIGDDMFDDLFDDK
ncbi:hypothetical protein FSP39_011569 [Pinctada imbricata]|uniref:Uncharacterized protein n=1 Tax=Pinctada imbricata TaxID=66713 RepID=A0AA89BZJ1_PINIB|nr:hypothetical protein FSP39_011569 [Pinctada imbricata]